MKRLLRFFGFGLSAAACLTVLPGCHPDAVFPLNSTEGKVLEQMLDEGRQVPTDPPEGLPVRFDAVSIDRLDDWYYGHWISGRLTWEWTALPEQSRAALRRLVKEPVPADARIEGVYVRLEYLGHDGGKLAENSIYLTAADRGGRVKLMNFGRGGAPVRVRATVERVNVASPPPAIPPAAEEPTPAADPEK
jgi:hypothetical protein